MSIKNSNSTTNRIVLKARFLLSISLDGSSLCTSFPFWFCLLWPQFVQNSPNFIHIYTFTSQKEEIWSQIIEQGNSEQKFTTLFSITFSLPSSLPFHPLSPSVDMNCTCYKINDEDGKSEENGWKNCDQTQVF